MSIFRILQRRPPKDLVPCTGKPIDWPGFNGWRWLFYRHSGKLFALAAPPAKREKRHLWTTGYIYDLARAAKKDDSKWRQRAPWWLEIDITPNPIVLRKAGERKVR